MQIKASYRLRSYRITEYETGVLWWETHFDFGKQRGGECFIHGNILILKPWSDEKHGLLIGEFLDQLKKLPSWDKTLHYCFFSELSAVKSGGKLTGDQLQQKGFRMNTQTPEADGSPGPLPGSYQIGRYRITVNEDGTISWQTPGGMNRIIGGQGLIESGILFLGPVVGDELKQNKMDFLYRLSRLPNWTYTPAWCRHPALRSCQEKQTVRSPKEISTPSKESTGPMDPEIFLGTPQKPERESLPKQPSPDFAFSKSLSSLSSRLNKYKWPKLSYSWPIKKIIWIPGLILFVLIGLIIAGIIAFHELGERFYRPYWYKKNHHEHHGKHHSQSGLPTILSILLLSLFSFLAINREINAEEKHIILEESGIHYPGGFDLNTVGEVQGRASHFSRPGKGPIHFLLATDRELYMVLTSPSWYWEEKHIKIPEGTEVFVRGSKSFGRDGKLYIVAQELRIPFSGQHFVFRGKDGAPLWKDHSRSGRETPGGIGSPAGGREGFGSGSGSRGHGRR
jgi:hypothetical protein